VVIEPSVADRIPAPKRLGSKIVVLIVPFRRYEIYAESGLESHHFTSFIARSDVIAIHEQFLVSYTRDGTTHVHYVDAVVDFADGKRIAHFIKYAEDAHKEDLNGLIRMIAATGNHKFDEYRVLTEFDISPTTIANSELIVRCGRNFDIDAIDLVRNHLRSSPPVVTPRMIAGQTEVGSRGSDALIALLQSGDVELVRASSKITPDTRFNNCVGRRPS
jgi:hypothetical protein